MPLIIVVGDGGHLEWRVVQQDELLVGDGVHHLYFIAHLDVLCDGLVKVGHTWILGSPATEERVFLHLPDHFHAVYSCVQVVSQWEIMTWTRVQIQKIFSY